MSRIIKMNAKCSDLFYAELLIDGKHTGQEHDGYVPEFFPGNHYGDYVILNIDIDTGKILNWKTPTTGELYRTFRYDDEKKETT
ncbi:hypothetical protein UFOVP276_23 [uncultured Caudovirales phage]|uniref:Uncharacterized protein n=1 Tax=uncultured Caudovirales phage TaxID=2100421 RepID=A0A6J5LDX9_9CAUD|nr:hypothetical protein UFOVP127_160 [uncultured Caudovirales phage]CAB4134867.1 hypothetical protein UFOVP276_23 [uncultured Caudovirales phage]